MQLNRFGMTALLGGLIIAAGVTGYMTAVATSYSGHYNASQYHGYTGPTGPGGGNPAASSSPMTGKASPMTGKGSADGYTDPSLAQYLAQKAGTRLAGRAPQEVPIGQVKGLSQQAPAGASIDARTDTITFAGTTASFTVVSIAPGAPDMTFRVAGLTNPTIIVPKGAQVTVRYINNDSDEAHGWLVTSNEPPFSFGQPAMPAIAGASISVIGDPVSGNDGADTVSFTASTAGNYSYICPMPGHAQMGMHGSFIVR